MIDIYNDNNEEKNTSDLSYMEMNFFDLVFILDSYLRSEFEFEFWLKFGCLNPVVLSTHINYLVNNT